MQPCLIVLVRYIIALHFAPLIFFYGFFTPLTRRRQRRFLLLVSCSFQPFPSLLSLHYLLPEGVNSIQFKVSILLTSWQESTLPSRASPYCICTYGMSLVLDSNIGHGRQTSFSSCFCAAMLSLDSFRAAGPLAS